MSRAKGIVALVVRVAPAVCAALAAVPAAAETLPIEVPVAVKGLPPEVSEGAVTCAVFTEIDGQTSNLGYGGFGSERFPIRGGAYQGRISVPVALDVASVSMLRSYRCTLYFIRHVNGQRKSGAAIRLTEPGEAEYRDEFRRAPGSPFVGEAKGTVE
ncbi:MAG: hypothetical protein IT515_16340 [Burkholderiales bacterium]|nr:hypothetical protein [Burkholderiales bacterium]